MTENYLTEKAKSGSRLKYEAILAKVPDIEQNLMTGYQASNKLV